MEWIIYLIAMRKNNDDGSETVNRRSVLRTLGAGSVAAVAGMTGSVAASDAVDFDPYDVVEVGDFAEEYLVDKRIEKDGAVPDEIRFKNEVPELKGLSSTQQEALADGVRPSVLCFEAQGGSAGLTVEGQSSPGVETIGDDSLDKWN